MRDKHTPPRIAIKIAAKGLCLMAVFTTLWAIVAFNGLHGRDHYAEIVIFGILVIAFISNAIYFFSLIKKLPGANREEDLTESKRSGKWFTIIFAAEGLGIFIGANLVVNFGYPNLAVPVIALVVGLHFFPLGKIFKRTLDYYIASWSTLVAICSILFSLKNTFPPDDILAFTGIGMAIATSCYGLFMIAEGRRLAKMVIS